MAKLNNQIQTFIVQQFAQFATPQEIVDLVKENFGVETSRPQVFFYNADMNPKLSEKWKAIFAAARKKFLDDVSVIPIANKSYRLKELDGLYKRQKRQTERLQNPVEMRATLEQAAKESGDAFTNHRIVTGKDGELAQPIADALGQFNKMLDKVYGGSSSGESSEN